MHLAPLALSIVSLVPAPQDAQLVLVDRVEVIVNDEILTFRQVMGTAALSIPDGSTLTANQLAELHRKVGLDLIDERLQVQGGIDMGFEEEAVMRVIADSTDRQIGSAGGVIQMAEELDENGISLFEQESRLRRNLYRFSWDRAITGANVGVSGRAYRDRHVRPGQLKLRYALLENGQPGAQTIQGTAARYHLQELIFPIPEGQTESETTRVRAEEVRKSLLEGLDFTTAVRGSSNPSENDGLLPPLTSEQLVRNGGPEIAAFAISAEAGQISRPMPVLIGRSIAGWRLMKLIDSDAPLLPIFEAPKTQTLLRKAIQADSDNYLRSEGLKSLNQGAYIWFPGSVEE
jgi:hypothetical protein